MKKKLCVILALAFVLALAFLAPIAPKASAAAKIPFTIDCRTGCESEGIWNGTSYGLYDSYQVSNPDMTVCNVCNYARMNMIRLGTSDVTSSIVVGIMKQNGLNGWCGMANNNKLYYSVQAFGSGGISDHIYSHCAGVPSADFNSRAAWKIAPYVSNGGGMLVQLFSVNYDGSVEGTSAFHIPYSSGVIHSGNVIKRDEFFFGQPFDVPSPGHWVWGVSWLYPQWATGDGVLHYQTSDFSQHVYYGFPVYFYWWQVPAPGNSGGQLNSCIYDNTNFGCTIGG